MIKLIGYFNAFFELLVSSIISRKLIWDLINRSAIKKFQILSPKLSKQEQLITEKIEKFGFAVTDLSFFNDSLLKDIQLFKKSCTPYKSDIKTFLTYYLGGEFKNTRQNFNKSNPLLELALNDKLVTIVNYYFKMLSRLTYLEINKTEINHLKEPEMSQKFHKDPGIHKCIKVFIYLNDVTTKNGPFTYVQYSHKHQEAILNQKRFGSGGIYPNRLDFDNLINKDNIIPILGKAGTVIIADTTGLHCGGNSITKSRTMATVVYYPPGDLKKSKIDINIPGFYTQFPNLNYLIPKN